MVKIVLADDHGIVRDGIKSTLRDEKTFKIVGEASNGLEAIERVKALAPDIIIIDINMPEMNGIDATTIITKKYPNTKSLVLSMHDNEDYILKSIEAGASGYLLKDTNKEEFVKAIKAVAKGEKYFSTSISNILATGYLHRIKKEGTRVGEDDSESGLTRRENGILKLIVQGRSNREIADSLSISIRTIEVHRSNMMKKLKVKNAVELVKFAMENNLV
ncbi:MAG TPA: response regulator transcription factor [Cytophagaceae bacterium]|nr:response regulator transcription factor [Cytophagaceae bacterium]